MPSYARDALVAGEVISVTPERRDKAPPDIGRTMIVIALVLILLGFCGVAAAASMAIWLALVIVGLGGAGCMLPLLLPLATPIVGPLLGWVRGQQEVSILSFQVLDLHTKRSMDATLYRKRGGTGSVRLGDKAAVWGSQNAGGLVRAHKIRVYESNAYPTDSTLLGDRPLPISAALSVLGLVLLALVFGFLFLMGWANSL